MNELTYVVQYFLDFGTFKGVQQNWRLELLRGYSGNTIPSDFLQTPESLVGTEDPITIKWAKDDDVYKPIVGSSADINLEVQRAGQYPDFNDFPQFTWQVRLRYGIDAQNTDTLLTFNGGQTLDIVSIIPPTNTGDPTAYRATPSSRSSSGDLRWSVDLREAGHVVVVRENAQSDWQVLGTTISAATLGFDTFQIQDPNVISGFDASWQFGTRTTSTRSDYWCGFINPINTKESVTTFPFTISYTATDRLGLLENQAVPRPEMENTATPLLSYVQDALIQTGLGLDLYIDSGILDGTADALTTLTTNSSSVFTNQEQTSLVTHKEQLEGILSAVNCKVKQAMGRWYIYNASTLADSTTWTVYNYDATTTPDTYVAGTAVTENLLLNVTGDNATQELIPIYSDLDDDFRRPVGSVECEPGDLIERNYIPDPCFATGTTGVRPNASSIDQTLDRSRFGGSLRHPSCEFGLFTLRNRFDIGESDDIWFETVNLTVDPNAPIDVNFDWIITQRSNQDVYLTWNAELTLTNPIEVPNPVTFANTRYGNNLFWQTQNVSTFRWNFADEEWETGTGFDDGNKPSRDNPRTKREVSAEAATWFSVNETLGPQTYFDPAESQNMDITGTLKLTFFYLRSKRSGRARWEGNDTNRVGVSVTNIQVRNMYDNDVINPTFERIQDNYTSTYTYNPRYASGIPFPIFQRTVGTNGTSTFNRRDVTESDTLERIGTQLKLNDFRNRFKQYNGTFTNNTSTPAHPVNKIFLNWASAGYVETAGGIINGAEFSPRMNEFKPIFYIPNQATDIAGDDGTIAEDGTLSAGFYEEDVNLVGMPFPGRTGRKVYSLALVVDGLDDTGNRLQTPDSQGRNPGDAGYVPTFDSLEPETPVIVVSGEPGTVVRQRVTLVSANNFEANASNLMFFDGTQTTGFFSTLEDGEDTAEAITGLHFVQSGRNVDAIFDVTIPENSEFEQIHIAGEVDPFIADNRTWTIDFSLATGLMNAVLTSTQRVLRGRPGDVGFLNVFIAASAGHELDADSFSIVDQLPTGVNLIARTQFGTGVLFELSVEFQSTNQTASLAINGNDGTAIAAGLQTSTITVNFSETIQNVALSRTQLVATGFVGQVSNFSIFAHAADGFVVNSSNFSVVENSPNISMENAIGRGEAVQIPFSLTFGATDVTIPVTVNGNAQQGGADTVNLTVNFTNNIANTSLTDTSEVFILNPGQQIHYTNTLTADPGLEIVASDVTLTEADASGLINFSTSDAGRGAINLSSSITAPNADATATLTIDGNTINEPFLLTLNLSETLPQGKLTQQSYTRRFGFSDFNTSEQFAARIEPTEGGMQYTNVNQITFPAQVGITFTDAAVVNNGINFNVNVAIPANEAAFPDGTVGPLTYNAEITAGQPTQMPATAITVGAAGRVVSGQTAVVNLTADGAWEVIPEFLIPINEPTVRIAPSSGFGNTTLSVTPSILAGNNGQIVNADGSEGNNGFRDNFSRRFRAVGGTTVLATLTGEVDLRGAPREDDTTPIVVQSDTASNIRIVAAGTAPTTNNTNTIYFEYE